MDKHGKFILSDHTIGWFFLHPLDMVSADRFIESGKSKYNIIPNKKLVTRLLNTVQTISCNNYFYQP